MVALRFFADGRSRKVLTSNTQPYPVSRVESTRAWLCARPVTAVFVSLATVPVVLALLSFRQLISLPDPLLSELEPVFWLVTYAPVSASRTVLFEPLGFGWLFSAPVLEQIAVVLTLGGFYYLVSYLLVRVGKQSSEYTEQWS